jgi:rhamnogalacturonyl hydrolase YesR
MSIPNPRTIQAVKSAMLCIQRFQWEQGCVAQAILEYEGLADEVIRLCEAAVLRSAPDGRVGIMEKNESVTDPAAIGEALLLAAQQTQRADLKEAADKLYQYLKYKAPRTRDGIIYHFDGTWAEQQLWVDAHYMAPPFLCKYGDAGEALKQIKGFRSYLYNEEKQLLSHIWDDKKQQFGREAFWGVGNGWAVAGITRVIAMLSDSQNDKDVNYDKDINNDKDIKNRKDIRDDQERKYHNENISISDNIVADMQANPIDYTPDIEYLITYVKALIDGFIRYQREDGLFHNVLDDPASFVETNAGQMLAYAIYRGVKAGYLDKHYLSYADKARAAAYAVVDEYGFVRGVCGMPMFDAPGVAAEGQAFFILMEAAARDLYE